ncbi:unnamed protein product, partial [Heterosigma akashiwo]
MTMAAKRRGRGKQQDTKDEIVGPLPSIPPSQPATPETMADKAPETPVTGWLKYADVIAFLLRLVLIAWGDWQDSRFEVKYTDIDYHVFTDAARMVTEGKSAFD